MFLLHEMDLKHLGEPFDQIFNTLATIWKITSIPLLKQGDTHTKTAPLCFNYKVHGEPLTIRVPGWPQSSMFTLTEAEPWEEIQVNLQSMMNEQTRYSTYLIQCHDSPRNGNSCVRGISHRVIMMKTQPTFKVFKSKGSCCDTHTLETS